MTIIFMEIIYLLTALPNFYNSRHGKTVVSRRVQLEGFALISVLSNHACKFVPHFQHYFPIY